MGPQSVRAPALADAALVVELDAPLPAEVSVGGGTAVFICGWCFCPAARIRSLAFVLDGSAQPVMAHGMPRLDPFRELHPGRDPFSSLPRDDEASADPLLLSYRSGFWGLLRIGPEREQRAEAEVVLRAELDTGAVVSSTLGRVTVQPAPDVPVVSAADGDPLVAICMATHNPPADLLARQLDSIRAQSHPAWICLISDDCSRPDAFATLQAAVAGDPRFILSRSGQRLGFYRNFERAMTMVPKRAGYVALADQDDYWHPDKLETLLAEIGDAQLAYSDARIVTRDAAPISETYWVRRRNNHDSLSSLLFANVVTGAASLFRRELLEDALPFPPSQFAHYHDHWLALTALCLGDIRFVARPLYDYVQHGEASLGHATANRMPTLGERLRSLRTRSARDRVRKWRMHYFVDIARLLQFATVLEMRCGARMEPAKRRELQRFLGSEGSPLALAGLFRRGLRELVGRPETLGAEWMLFGALVWRRLLRLSARDLPQPRWRLDAVPPPNLAPGPDRAAGLAVTAARAIAEKVAPLELEVREDAPRRVNLLIPTIDLEHLFGGYIAKLNLARRLAQRGHRVRVVTVDPTGPLPRSWARTLESYSGLAGLAAQVEVGFGRESRGLEVSAEDGFIATTWWTAHIAHEALGQLGGDRFVYLIQEYEPFTFPMGTYAALAEESYSLPHFALFSTELLRGYFRNHRIGVYAAGSASGDQSSISFQNAITTVEPPLASELAARASRRLLFYARPEAHAARNLFELGVLALARAADDGCFRDGWELHGVGTLDARRRIPLADGAALELLPRSGQTEYARILRRHDLGLALMYTPHPSLVPIEMASAGMLTVTNSFENKTPEAMARISTNLIAVEPSIGVVAEALRRAAGRIDDFEGRARGSEVDWSRDWDRSFDDSILARIEAVLKRA